MRVLMAILLAICLSVSKTGYADARISVSLSAKNDIICFDYAFSVDNMDVFLDSSGPHDGTMTTEVTGTQEWLPMGRHDDSFSKANNQLGTMRWGGGHRILQGALPGGEATYCSHASQSMTRVIGNSGFFTSVGDDKCIMYTSTFGL